jgi:hypothetical protein
MCCADSTLRRQISGVQRIFWLGERIGLRLRSEFFNFLNHPNFESPTNLLTSALFGRSTQTLANGLESAGAKRRLQSAVPGWRPALHSVGAQARILSLKSGVIRYPRC